MLQNIFSASAGVLAAVILGALFGNFAPHNAIAVVSDYVDYIILLLVFLVMLNIQISKVFAVIKQPKVLLACLFTNFLVIPFIGFGLAYTILGNQPLIAIGVAIYCMSPCTDWFLGFTKMAKGNTALGGLLLPVNMIIQFALYPVYLALFSSWLDTTSVSALVDIENMFDTLYNWFLLPVLAAVVFNCIKIDPLNGIRNLVANCSDYVVWALVFAVFATNVTTITDNVSLFAWVLVTVLIFFVICFVLTETVAKKLQLQHEDTILFTMTTAARNAPLMLGLTMTAFPNQPLVYAAIIVGMLVEFPYLALLVARYTKRA